MYTRTANNSYFTALYGCHYFKINFLMNCATVANCLPLYLHSVCSHIFCLFACFLFVRIFSVCSYIFCQQLRSDGLNLIRVFCTISETSHSFHPAAEYVQNDLILCLVERMSINWIISAIYQLDSCENS